MADRGPLRRQEDLTLFKVVEGQLAIDDFTKKGGVNKLLGPGKPFTAGKKNKKKKKKK